MNFHFTFEGQSHLSPSLLKLLLFSWSIHFLLTTLLIKTHRHPHCVDPLVDTVVDTIFNKVADKVIDKILIKNVLSASALGNRHLV